MEASSFDVKKRPKKITMFKVGKLWVFKHFFEERELFYKLSDYYHKENYRFEFKTIGDRNKALKLLELSGFDIGLVEDLRGYVVKISKFCKYAPILKNSVAYRETANERIFVMKDLASVEEAVSSGATVVEGNEIVEMLVK